MFGGNLLSTVSKRRLTKMSFEGLAECRLRLITNAQRRLGDREILFRE
jgi:hypothetical protein